MNNNTPDGVPNVTSQDALLDDPEAVVQHVQDTAVQGGLGEGFGLPLNADYFNIESFLTDQTLVDVVTLDICPFGSFADKTTLASGELHIKKGCSIKLPFATARILHNHGLVSVHMPSIFNESILSNLMRNATVVDVRSLHPYYFEFGFKLATLYKDAQLKQTLRDIAEKRMVFLMKLACDHVENEYRDQQSRSGLLSDPVILTNHDTNTTKTRQHSKTTRPDMTTMSTISGDLFSENYQDTSQQDLDASIFLKGLSVSEKQTFLERKLEVSRCFADSLF